MGERFLVAYEVVIFHGRKSRLFWVLKSNFRLTVKNWCLHLLFLLHATFLNIMHTFSLKHSLYLEGLLNLNSLTLFWNTFWQLVK
jgi:hypothetical protein